MARIACRDTLSLDLAGEVNWERGRKMTTENGAVVVTGSATPLQGVRAASNGDTAIQDIRVRPIPFVIAKKLITEHHYLRSLPGGTMLCFGVLVGKRLLGAMTFGAAPRWPIAWCRVLNGKIV